MQHSFPSGLPDAAGDDATVVAIVDDITIMGTLEALSNREHFSRHLRIT